MRIRQRFTITALLLWSFISLAGCVGTIIGTTTDAALAVAKVPFKAGAAIIDVASDDEDDE